MVGIGKKPYGFANFCTLKNNFAIHFTWKKHLECIGTAVTMLYLG